MQVHLYIDSFFNSKDDSTKGSVLVETTDMEELQTLMNCRLRGPTMLYMDFGLQRVSISKLHAIQSSTYIGIIYHLTSLKI